MKQAENETKKKIEKRKRKNLHHHPYLENSREERTYILHRTKKVP